MSSRLVVDGVPGWLLVGEVIVVRSKSGVGVDKRSLPPPSRLSRRTYGTRIRNGDFRPWRMRKSPKTEAQPLNTKPDPTRPTLPLSVYHTTVRNCNCHPQALHSIGTRALGARQPAVYRERFRAPPTATPHSKMSARDRYTGPHSRRRSSNLRLAV